MKTKIKLEQAFRFARQFFPEWDRKGEWRIKVDRRKSSEYDPNTKIISLNRWYDEGFLFNLIIHEICHFTRDGHGKRFRTRMKRASDQMREWSKLLAEQADQVEENIRSSFDYNKLITMMGGEFKIEKMFEVIIKRFETVMKRNPKLDPRNKKNEQLYKLFNILKSRLKNKQSKGTMGIYMGTDEKESTT